MTLSPFQWPAVQILTAVLVVLAGVWFWRRTALKGGARLAVAGLRLAAIGLLCWILSDPRSARRVSGAPPAALILVDQSGSMDFPSAGSGKTTRLEEARAAVEAIRKITPSPVLWFGTGVSAEPMKPEAAGRSGSLLAGALRQILSTEDPPASIVVLSDGAVQDAEDLPLVAAAAVKRGVSVAALTLGGRHETRNVSITACDAPAFTRAGTRIPVKITVRRDGCRDRTLSVRLQDEQGKTLTETALAPDAAQSPEQSVTFQVPAGLRGFKGKVAVKPVEDEITLTDNTLTLNIPVKAEKLRILYMEGTNRLDHGIPEPLFLAEALTSEGMEVDLLVMNRTNDEGGSVLVGWPWRTDPVFKPDTTKGFPKTREELYQYDAVICSDIPRVAFTDDQIRWTVDFVAERGGAFIMVGGKSSFGSGMWDQTPWDSLIPLDMAGAERGLTFDRFKPYWPPEAIRHPILAQLPLDTGETLEGILSAHPLFLGTNFVNRAKPAATVIMRQGKADAMPVMAVQPFGKGRTMGFASDVTFYWGTLHNRAWGPPETAVPVEPEVKDPVYKKTPAKFYNNGYFRRFWIHAMRWLTEGSLRAKGDDFTAGTSRLTWTRGTRLPVTALSADASVMAQLAKGICTAEVSGVRGSRVRLRFDAGTRRFEGQLAWPANPPEECTVVVEASAPGLAGKKRATFTVRLPVTDLELSEPDAKPEVLAALAKATDGAVPRSPAAAAAWLASRQRAAEAVSTLVESPSWSQPWLLVAVLLLLSAEWLVRRIYG
ncbi:MAG: glutamine amidotransferase [Verrucomicrobiota bacterium]